MSSIDFQITEIEARITDVTAQIAVLEPACNVENQELCDLVCRKKNRLQRLLANYSSMRDRLVASKANQESGFSTEQQTVVDEINTTYSNAYSVKLDELKKDTAERKTKFFELYAAAVASEVGQVFLDCNF